MSTEFSSVSPLHSVMSSWNINVFFFLQKKIPYEICYSMSLQVDMASCFATELVQGDTL